MVKKRTWIIWIGLGIAFLLNAVFGRYLVLPGYLANLRVGQATFESAVRTVPVWKVIRYLVWAYSFKLGIFFIGTGALLRSSIPRTRFWILVSGGIAYLALAYVPMPGPYSLFFGIAGGLITIMVVFILMRWANERLRLGQPERASADYRLIGYFFFAMATYNLCPLMGVKAFALAPDKMIEFGLQAEAASFATHIMIELVLGWLFILLSYRRAAKKATSPG
jgi:hypothetical protein